MNLTMTSMTLGPLVRALFNCILTIPLVVLVAWYLDFFCTNMSRVQMWRFTFVMFVSIWVESKGGWIIEILWRSNSWFSLQISNEFYSYCHGLNLPHSFRLAVTSPKTWSCSLQWDPSIGIWILVSGVSRTQLSFNELMSGIPISMKWGAWFWTTSLVKFIIQRI